MKILLIFFTFSLISGAVRCVRVTGYSGGSLLVRSGIPWHKDNAKYMRKLQSTTIIYYRNHDLWINDGRFTLFCNNYGNLMIYIRDLITQDAGTYRIGVYGKWFIDMTLTVKEGQSFKIKVSVEKVMIISKPNVYIYCT
ncbi:hypothetical protein PO909_016228 [Leuciscus waleckii]